MAWLDRMEEQETRGLLPVPGAPELLASLPSDRWAIVTSGSPAVAGLRLKMARVPTPGILVTAADVLVGKPAPDGYLQAASRLGVAPTECVVVEDAPAGVAAGKAAGMRVIAVLGTATAARLAQADLILPALGQLRASRAGDGGILLSVRDV